MDTPVNMNQVKTFASLGLKPTKKRMAGKRKALEEVLEKPITITYYDVRKSLYPQKSEKCVLIEYTYKNKMYFAISIAQGLIDILQQQPAEQTTPFITTISNKKGFYEFI